MPIENLDDSYEEEQSKPKRFNRIYESLSEEEFGKLLDHTKSPKHRIAFILAYGSGLRVSEVIKLNQDNFDLKNNPARIFIREGKGRKDRIVNVPKWFKQKNVELFPLKITERALESAFRRASYRAGINSVIGSYEKLGKTIPIQKFHFHSLRHSYATRCLEKNVSIHDLQSMLGHNSLATTSRYTKANPKDAIQSILDKGV